MFEDLAGYDYILVTGPQRSGTTIAAKMIAEDTGKLFVSEGHMQDARDEKGALWHIMHRVRNIVIQCPRMSAYVHEYAAENVLVVFMHRELEDIKASEAKIGWGDALQRQRYHAEDDKRHIAQIKWAYWRKVQQDQCWDTLDLEYDDLADHHLWVRPEHRNWTGQPRTISRHSQFKDEIALPLDKRLAANFILNERLLFQRQAFPIELSVVSGTYNRLDYLRQMVQSVRASIGTVSYEIVLVDGGSTDGTLAWCKQQPDIRLIEHGELLGAIKSFNDGLYAAQGKYCVVGNDDVIYEDETLLNAVSYMHDHPDVGVGCFYQNRDHPGHYDLSYMPAIVDGRQMRHVYGQVCIVPKWLGDAVGWWGNFEDQRTYGGDNNLSCFVLEAGYKVTGIQCACITDLKADDELRKRNHDDALVRRGKTLNHPDSIAWGKRWTHPDGSCGPIVLEEPTIENPLVVPPIRFLYLPIYEPGHDVQKRTKTGLRKALDKYGLVYEYDYMGVKQQHGGEYCINYLRDIIDSWHPHLLLTQIHSPSADLFNEHSVSRLKEEYPNVVWVNWNGDYHPEDLLGNANMRMARLFDLQAVVTTQVRDAYAANRVNWIYWQIGYEPWEEGSRQFTDVPSNDIVFLANAYSQKRVQLGQALRSMPYEVGLYGSWPRNLQPRGNTLYNFDAGAKVYQGAKLAIGDDQWRAPGFVSNRLFEAMASGGALYMQQAVPQLDALLGLVDGQHYVSWFDVADLQAKIQYYMEHEDERAAIAQAGTAYIRRWHSFDVRVGQLLTALRDM